jgi:Zn-dependent peptidase ImmA (M78 family)
MAGLISRKTATLTLEWCINTYGPSIHNDLATLDLKLRSKLEFYGEYDSEDNVIYLNPKKHRSLKEWCNTIIHEYTHFRQNIDGMYTRYYEKGRTYDTHPHEIAANRTADRDTSTARRWVLNQLKRKP